MQLVFGRDAIMNLTFDEKLAANQTAKISCNPQNNQTEINKRIQHKYKVNDTVLVKNKRSTKFSEDAYNGS